MPYPRPTLTSLRNQVSADISAVLPGADAQLRFSSLQILGSALAGLAQLQYGYTDWVSRQANPFTATDEFLEAWAALKNVYREPATQAGLLVPGTVTFPGTNGVVLPINTPLVRGDGVTYTTSADGTVAGGSVTVPAYANADPAGLTGAFGNCGVGTVLPLGAAISGISSTGSVASAFTGGFDVELDDKLRSRMLQVYQHVPQGGAQQDYVTWALQVNGVTRAWANPNGFGAGTVVVYPMFDVVEAAFNGFPQGISGVATAEHRGTPTATGDQLAVADWIYPLRPVTALVYVQSPTAMVVDFTISGISTIPAATKALIADSIAGLFVAYGSPLSDEPGQNGVVYLSYIESAIASIAGTAGFVIESPSGNIVGTTGQLPVVGTITYT
ncbi:putative phage protein gp47/JayE [Paraburkholderia sp. BL8N3]|nr:baseplate J/gp47 family protein [Paraburkholderia sp. BL8N3]TCK36736.1 putative phage protein gp47/JayE [Paraburkholderia sp. BL8N3]